MTVPSFLLLFSFLALVFGCKKDGLPKADCEKLKQAIEADDAAQVGEQITAFIHSLPSDKSTPENLANLAATLSGQCAITATVGCFSCIETLPAQSEIYLSFSVAGAIINRTIDLSYTTENKMIFRGLHE